MYFLMIRPQKKKQKEQQRHCKRKQILFGTKVKNNRNNLTFRIVAKGLSFFIKNENKRENITKIKEKTR